MATICAECLTITTNITAGRCPKCQPAPRQTGWTRYPATYRANRAQLLANRPPCYACGKPADTADHITPRSHGGTHDISNLRPACLSCNSARKDNTTDQ